MTHVLHTPGFDITSLISNLGVVILLVSKFTHNPHFPALPIGHCSVSAEDKIHYACHVSLTHQCFCARRKRALWPNVLRAPTLTARHCFHQADRAISLKVLPGLDCKLSSSTFYKIQLPCTEFHILCSFSVFFSLFDQNFSKITGSGLSISYANCTNLLEYASARSEDFNLIKQFFSWFQICLHKPTGQKWRGSWGTRLSLDHPPADIIHHKQGVHLLLTLDLSIGQSPLLIPYNMTQVLAPGMRPAGRTVPHCRSSWLVCLCPLWEAESVQSRVFTGYGLLFPH